MYWDLSTECFQEKKVNPHLFYRVLFLLPWKPQRDKKPQGLYMLTYPKCSTISWKKPMKNTSLRNAQSTDQQLGSESHLNALAKEQGIPKVKLHWAWWECPQPYQSNQLIRLSRSPNLQKSFLTPKRKRTKKSSRKPGKRSDNSQRKIKSWIRNFNKQKWPWRPTAPNNNWLRQNPSKIVWKQKSTLWRKRRWLMKGNYSPLDKSWRTCTKTCIQVYKISRDLNNI